MIIAKVPTATYLRKYALWREGLPPDGVLDLKAGGLISCVLGFIHKGKLAADPRPGAKLARYEDAIPYYLNPRRVNGTRRCFLNVENIRLFNTLLRRDLAEYLVDKSAANKKLGINEVETIYQFINEVDILEDISYDALKKSMDRLRKSKEKVLQKTSFCNQSVVQI